ncbi:MAG: hypothetical protein LBR88_09870 [Zoogloeaceae bacterium]|nr:hypothetical protein [Zoogloeaceae bacterium]
MLPLLPFAAGVVLGAFVPSLVRKAKISPRVSKTADLAGRKARAAAASGLDTLTQASARWRDRIAPALDTEPEPAAEVSEAERAPASPPKKSRAKSRETA